MLQVANHVMSFLLHGRGFAPILVPAPNGVEPRFSSLRNHAESGNLASE